MVRFEVVGQLDTDEVRAVSALVEAATEADGVRPLSEHVGLHLRYGGDERGRNVLAWKRHGGRDALVGYAHLDVTDEVAGPSAELTVHPAHRKAGLGQRLVSATLAEANGRLRLWAHGEHPGAAALAVSMGFHRSRALWQMRRSLYAGLPAAVVPDGVEVRTFRPGADDDEWVRLNAAAFRRHAEQGQWTGADLRRRMQEPWFDASGFFLALRDGRQVGFHWTKVHGGSGDHDVGGPHAHEGHGHDPIGEVYVVGVHPDEQGTGLGRALTLVGLGHLRQRGLPAAMLYVDADNTAAIRLYTALGFTRWETDVLFSRDASAAPHPPDSTT